METASDALDAQCIFMTSPTEFAELYERHYTAVYRTALRVTGNPADAEDVLQTVFLRVLGQSGRLESPRMPGAYLRRAAVNAALDLLRRSSMMRRGWLPPSVRPCLRSACAALWRRWRRTMPCCSYCATSRD